MKKYKDGKMIEISKEESEQIQNIFKNFRNQYQKDVSSFGNHEERIKILEEAVAKLLAKQKVEEG